MAKADSIGYVHPNTRHGFSRTDEYKIWERMISRCHNRDDSNFAGYGGIGISVCQRWRESFVDFLTDMGSRPSKGHSLDRYPNQAGNYEPGNVRWATATEQSRNQRSNHLLTHDGQTMTIAAWSEKLGLNRWTIHNRLKYGWSVDRVLSTSTTDSREKAITFNGETMLLSQWAIRLGLTPSALTNRFKRGLPIEKVLSASTRKKPKRCTTDSPSI